MSLAQWLVWLACICAGVLVTAAAGGALYYRKRCIWWRNRIAEIREERTVYQGWNLKRLKETVRDLEYERVDRMELIFR